MLSGDKRPGHDDCFRASLSGTGRSWHTAPSSPLKVAPYRTTDQSPSVVCCDGAVSMAIPVAGNEQWVSLTHGLGLVNFFSHRDGRCDTSNNRLSRCFPAATKVSTRRIYKYMARPSRFGLSIVGQTGVPVRFRRQRHSYHVTM